MQQYEVVLAWDSVDAYTKERVIGAIAAIIQALSIEGDQLKPLSMLIQFVERDVAACIKSMEASKAEEFQASGICALKCLVSIGKSLQTPESFTVDLETNQSQSTFWTEGEGVGLQSKIIQTIETVTGLMKWNSDVVEASCQILRAGYKESKAGLFVFPPKVTVDFVLASNLETARLDYVLDTGGALLGKHVVSSEVSLESTASSLLKHFIWLIGLMGGKQN